MRRWFCLFAVGVVCTAGCKLFNRDREADLASRPKAQPKGGNGWLTGPGPGLDRVDAPAADSWANPTDPGYDVAREVRGVLAGFVEDPDGRKLKDVFIEVEPAEGAGGGAPVGVQTDKQGYFLIKGLKPKQTYVLTARSKVDGQELTGRVYAQTGLERSQHIRITLIEGLSFPAGSPPRRNDLPTPRQPESPPATIPPPSVVPSGAVLPRDDGGGTGLALPGRPEDIPPPAAPTTTRPPLQPNDLTTTIPSPAKSEWRGVRSGAEFTLIDPAGGQRKFPAGRRDELVLLDFMTTTCAPCKKAIPTLTGLQDKYGRHGLEVVGVVCDEEPISERKALAASYRRAQRLNYPLYVEPGGEPGAIRERFRVEVYPTLVLLDGAGEVLWRGSPRDAADLDRVIAAKLR